MPRPELRRHERILVPQAYTILIASNGKGPRLRGTVSVIGLGGMFVRTKIPVPPGTVLNVTLTCSILSFESQCTVRHVNPNGMGVEFTGLTPENEQKLKALLVRLKA
jgi:PilZ domain